MVKKPLRVLHLERLEDTRSKTEKPDSFGNKPSTNLCFRFGMNALCLLYIVCAQHGHFLFIYRKLNN